MLIDQFYCGDDAGMVMLAVPTGVNCYNVIFFAAVNDYFLHFLCTDINDKQICEKVVQWLSAGNSA